MKTTAKLATVLMLSLTICAAAGAAADAENLAAGIYEATGVTGGFVVHIGCEDGRLTAALHPNERFTVHGLARTKANVRKAREYIREKGMYGQVSVDLLEGQRLPYIDGIATLVVSQDPGEISQEEIRRVLAPQGVAYIKSGDTWSKYVKPRPEDIDKWTHFFHDASGNPVAHDKKIDRPRGLQWVGSPRWARYHDHIASVTAMVCSGRRMFYIIDEGSKASVILPSHWKLVARDAFNGTILWDRKIDDWHPQLYPFKSGPAQLTRRLVVADGKVYAPLGRDEPMSVIDAATGEILSTLDKTAATEEIIATEGMVFTLTNRQPVPWDKFSAESDSCGKEKARVVREWSWNEQPRHIMAFDTNGGDLEWSVKTPVAPMTLAADGNRVAFHDGECIVCLDRNTGDTMWRSDPVAAKARIPTKTSHRLIIHGDYILFAGLDNRMRSLSAKDGEILWTETHPRSGHNSMEDMMVLQGLAWAGEIAGGGHSGIHYGRDIATGELEKKFPPDVETYWFHHRCYPSKATDEYILTSRTGIECIDPQNEHWRISHWIRGGCLYGIMPANGMIYTPPHDCACYAEAKMYGFRAVGPQATKHDGVDAVGGARLQRGPAFDAEIAASSSPDGGDWPTFRADNARSGFTETSVSADVRQAWTAELGDSLTSPVVAGGKLYIADADTHRLFALDANSGNTLWTFTAGGRIDSPPTVWKGRVYFGSRDGYVYCLRASDGELIWRFRAAPRDVRLMAFEQLESVWPVHGSVLVQDNVLYCVAGRSMFLDEGMLLLRIEPTTGRMISETLLDEKLPSGKGTLQDRIMRLQMPVALPDILSTDDERVYMRSQVFTKKGARKNIGPHSTDFTEQACIQAGEQKHLFAPYGYLDGSWFHRSYWVYGRSYSSGAGGWHKAAHYAPAGRILAFDDEKVYGYGRLPQYYRWTSRSEYHLFATSKQIPEVSDIIYGSHKPQHIHVQKYDSLNPANEALTVQAWVRATDINGVVVARGAGARGYALYLKNGNPEFAVRAEEKVYTVRANQRVGRRWTHLAGVLTKDKQLQIYVNGELVNTAKAGQLIPSDPGQPMQIGADMDGGAGDYESPFGIGGNIDEVMIFQGALSADEIRTHYENPGDMTAKGAKLVLYYPFDGGKPIDRSGNGNDGEVNKTTAGPGMVGDGLKIRSSDYIGSVVMTPRSNGLDPSQKPITAEAWVKAKGSSGVIVAHGGGWHGYSLHLNGRRPVFTLRIEKEAYSATADRRIADDWTHVVGLVDADKQLKVYIDGELAGTGEAPGFIAGNPGDAMEVGADEHGAVGDYSSPHGLKGAIDEVCVYDGALTEAQIRQRCENPAKSIGGDVQPMIHYSFEQGKAEDVSGNGHDGIIIAAETVAGKVGNALKFSGRMGGHQRHTIDYVWSIDRPEVIGRGLVVAGDTIFVAGPPDLVNEDKALYSAYDPKMQQKLRKQDAAMRGKLGATLWAVSKSTGKKLSEMQLDSPPAWDALIAANGKLYMATVDGKVICFRGE